MVKPNIPFSAMPDRRPLRLPGGQRVIVWTIVNVEYWSLERPMPRQVLPPPMGGSVKLDRANWSWHEYGLRVGFWRMLDLFAHLGVPVTLAINGSACIEYPRVARAAVDAGWEFMGHGLDQVSMQAVENETESIRQAIAILRETSGQRVRGWESPGLTGTADTLDLLAAAGIEYVSDLVLDEQPCDLTTKNGRMTALPYTVELNDVVLHAVEKHASDELLQRGVRQLNRLIKEGEGGVRVMSVSLHPYLIGAPHRFDFLETLYEGIAKNSAVQMMTGAQIVDWFHAERAAA
jgi:peptidoglycan/xylan/chitin deacetylase (PgdA/CDA1 family)